MHSPSANRQRPTPRQVPPRARRAGVICALLPGLTLLLGLSLLLGAGPAGAVELCGSEGIGYMRAAGISEAQIRRVCDLASRRSGVLALDTQRLENELGYCRVTLSLRNNSQQYLNAMTVTSEASRFEIFHFSNILPGDVGYASAKSRILMDCDELAQIKLRFHWPVSLRMADRPVQGARLAPYKPVLLNEVMEWTR